ncbi:translocation protein Sec62-domain-containing protein [Diplogelasinospora grovesii]|uniref:Translocation protein SEC62 n=1 Tax=Diplogelasinospora grovesii TaxID=303347 RepID=A0AAN6N8Q5_9PEZI|nr:translocation protein Sec62-domain-containing protein [Diplogelasinospora grovesii]
MQGGPMPGGPGGMPTPEQIAAMKRQLEHDAEKAGMTVPQFIEHIKQQQMRMQQQMMAMKQQQQQQQGGQQPQGQQQGGQQQQQTAPGQPQPIVPGPPNPVALALATFLRSQPLKPRTVILNGERKDMFKVKRALRALQSPAYEKARKKNPALPEITDLASLENTFKLLPMSMLALRVVKADPHEGHNHGPGVEHGKKKGKRVKGQWTVKIEPQQEAKEEMYYVWLWEGSQIMRKVYAALALLVIFAVVLYPLWPVKLRQGVYYLSWAFLVFLGLFFAMAIFRVILFCITYFVTPPGLWLFPNLWEDVSVVESFKPVWAWHDTDPKKKKKNSKSTPGTSAAGATFSATTGQPAPATATTTATATQVVTGPGGGAGPQQRNYISPRVEELGDDEE